MVDYNKKRRDFKALKSFIAGSESRYAQQIVGLTGGNDRNDREQHQPCPLCGGEDRFYCRNDEGTFHCRQCGFNGDLIDLVAKVKNVGKTEAFDIVAEAAGFDNIVGSPAQTKTKSPPKRVRFQDGSVKRTEYVYTDAEGNPCHKIVRTDGIDASTGEPGKTIAQCKMVDGQWEKGAPALTHPYQLPGLLQASINEIWIVEGEKPADALRQLLLDSGVTDIAVATSAMGAQMGKQWRKYVERHPALVEKRIRIFPDNDEPGMKYVQTVAAIFLEANPEIDVRIVKLPGLPDKGDFVDWYAGFMVDGKDESTAVEALKGYCEHPDYSEPVVAGQYNPQEAEAMLSQEVMEKTGIDILDTFLEQVVRISFSEDERVKHSTYYVRSIPDLLKTAQRHRWDIGMQNESPHFFTGESWQRVDLRTFRHFLQAGGMRQGIPHNIVKDHIFADKLAKQFASEARFPALSANGTPKINLRNGTLHFTPNGTVLKPFDKQDGLTYQLHYDFDESATAPLFKKFLDRVLPDVAVQKLIFQYIGYVFLRNLNLEKILFLYGGGANGKSVFLNIIQALVGKEQCCAYSLEGITKEAYQRAELGNYLLNVCSEISTRLGMDVFKKIASREKLQARHPYGRAFNVSDYATSIFAMNEMPKDVEQTSAFFRRFLIIPFDVRIPDDEQDPDLARKIIDSEMSGVLNYVIEGVQSLLTGGTFDIPARVRGAVEKFRLESDTALTFLEENGYRPCLDTWKPLRDVYKTYREQCLDGGGKPVSDRTFAQRLRNFGYMVNKTGKTHQTVVYAIQVPADNAAVVEEAERVEGEDGETVSVEYATYCDADRENAMRRLRSTGG